MLSHEIIKVTPPVYQSHYKPPKVTILEGLKPGDWVYYNYAGSPGVMSSAQCSIVLEVDENPTNTNALGDKKPYLLMALTGTSNEARRPDYNFNTDPWVRWTDGQNLAKVPDERKQELNDDFVSNYIETHLPQARRYLR